MSLPVKQASNPPPATIEDVITKGDLSKLTAEQRTEYYVKLCNSLSLNPLTQPFDWLVLNGRLQLYANRRCADQLRKINGININIVSQEQSDGLLTIHVKAKDKDGREDEDLGVVALPETLKGEGRANAILKAVTKAKRRVTLSIGGLGFLDETEVEDIPARAKEVVSAPAIAPPTPAAAALIEAAKQEAPAEQQASPGEPREITLGESPDWIWFGQTIIELAKATDWPDWEEKNRANLERMEKEAPKVYDRMVKAIKKAQKPAPKKKADSQTQPELKDDPETYLKWLKEQCDWFVDQKKPASDLMDFAKTQAEIISQGFPPDQAAANDLIKVAAQALG